MAKMTVKDTNLTILNINDAEYVCITDLARYKSAEHTDDVIKNWIRNRNTIELLGIWGAHRIATKFSDIRNLPSAGLIGDSAGAINALFSALAFCGVVIAIILQKRELELQREELKATNAQLEAQKDEFITQNETLKRQRFENTFFQMMSLQQEIINNLSFSYEESQETITRSKGGNKEYRSLALIPHTDENETQSSISSITKTLTGRDVFSWTFNGGVRDAISKKGINVYTLLKYPEYFDHYFRHLYRIIKFVDESSLIDKKDKYEYIGMVRATLSRYELVWLFYNCLSENGIDKFKPLIERYALLKNLRGELLVAKEHWSLYKEEAYEYTNHPL